LFSVATVRFLFQLWIEGVKGSGSIVFLGQANLQRLVVMATWLWAGGEMI
jgi:hypothetical protein